MIDLKTQAAREVARLVARHPTPEQVIAFHPSTEASARAYALIDAEREGTLTEEEQVELASYTPLENLMEMAKIEARSQLQQQAS